MNKKIVIAIDGPVGAGKSTISDEVAKRLGILHLDTGAMYRAYGLCALRAGVNPQDEEAVCALNPDIDVRHDGKEQTTLLAGEDVSKSIRTQEVGTAASAVSQYARVRTRMVARQREIAGERSILMDGRDIGMVVLPDADLKVFLTASPKVRAQRRHAELKKNGGTLTLKQVLAEIRARDLQDETRQVDPLRRAKDAVLLDTSSLNFEQTVCAILALVEAVDGQ